MARRGLPSKTVPVSASHQRATSKSPSLSVGRQRHTNPSQNLARGARTSSSSTRHTPTPNHITNRPTNDERPPPRPVAPSTGASTEAASHRQHTTPSSKRTHDASHSSSATRAPPVRCGTGKRQKTTEAREDLCCFCSVTSTCTSRNCPCAKAGRPCHSCDPGECFRCTNTVEALNRVIRAENTRRTSGIAARFRQRVGLAPALPLPLFYAHDNR